MFDKTKLIYKKHGSVFDVIVFGAGIPKRK